jgi:hypothetical protein
MKNHLRKLLNISNLKKRDKPIQVVIHICMETMQGKSLYSYLYLKLAKTLFLFLSFMFFSSTKSENWRVVQVLRKGDWHGGRGMRQGKG